jgi:hypothetical protein
MATPFDDFRNCIVRINYKKYTQDEFGLIGTDEVQDDYIDVEMFLEPSTSRNPTIPSDLDSFNQIRMGISVFPMRGFFINPERRPDVIQVNKDYFAIYKPEVFNLDSTRQYCEIRFILTPMDSVDASFFSGDNTEVIMVIRNNRLESDEYPEWY